MTRSKSYGWWLAVLIAGCILPSAAAQEPTEAGVYPTDWMGGMDYRLVGPYRGGRVTAVTGVPGDVRTFYMGSTGGGVWKTTDAGLTWRNVSDKVREDKPQEPARPMGDLAAAAPEPAAKVRPGDAFGSASVGAIAVAPSDPNVIYVGMGSACIRGNVSPGDGVYRSTDGGESWTHIGLEQAGQIGKIRVHPADPDLVYVAVLGHAFGPNPERGVYRSRDGGQSWQKVLFISDQAGAVDLAMDASNPRILYAAMWEVVRHPWEAISGGEKSGLYKTADGGDTWRELTEGLPEGIKGKIAVDVSPAQPSRVYALVEHKEKWGLYRSDDGGKSFRLINSDRNLITRAWYYTHLTADPQDPSTVYVNNVGFWRSEDGGKNFSLMRVPHGDNHALWIHPDHPEIMIQSNDGGANISNNGGRSWTTQANQPTAEMYRVTVDDQFPYWLYGGQQDNSAVAIPSQAPGGGIARQDWYTPGGCESAWVAVDPRDPDITYSGCYGGAIGRYDRKTGHEMEVTTYPQLAVGQQAADLKYRFQWNAPIRISPHDPSVLYHTSQYVHRSTDEGRSWELISPDLTHDEPSHQGYSGGPITWDNTGVEVFGTIFAFEESPQVAGLLWAGSDDGRVHVSRDGGTNWREVTPAGLPQWGTVNMIELSPHDPERVLLAVQRYRLDDFAPYIFRTNDGGQSWERLTDGKNGIPADSFVRVVREDPDRRGLLYAGTEFGMYASFDDGRSWQSLQLNLPVTPITDLRVKRKDLVVATQGRSYWILDDLSPLHELSAELAQAQAHLFAPRPAYQVLGVGGFFGGFDPAVGRNPDYGAWIYYHLGAELEGEGKTEVKIEILDADGKVLRSRSSQKEEPSAPNPFARYFPELVKPRKLSAKQGINRYVWDLRLGDAELEQSAIFWGVARGPEVPPGSYKVRLTVGEFSVEQPLEVRKDPRDGADQEGLQARFDLARHVWRSLTEAHKLLRASRDLRKQIAGLSERVEGEAKEEIAGAGKKVSDALTGIEDRLHQSKSTAIQDILNFPPQLDNQLIGLMDVIGSARGRPTAGSYQRYDDLRQTLDEQRQAYDRVLAGELTEFQALLAKKNVKPIILPALKDEP